MGYAKYSEDIQERRSDDMYSLYGFRYDPSEQKYNLDISQDSEENFKSIFQEYVKQNRFCLKDIDRLQLSEEQKNM